MEKIAEKIVSYGYFCKEIPKEFTTEVLGSYVYNLDLSASKLSKNLIRKWTKPVVISIPKKGRLRRELSIPNPMHYIRLAKELEENWDELKNHFSKSSVSLTTPVVSSEIKKGIVPKHKMSQMSLHKINGYIGNRYILKADIEQYYPGIYTHTIPWALHTKEVAKANATEKNNICIGDTIDTIIRNMQDGQTKGIAIGPVTSFIIQEIIGTAIDSDFKSRLGKDVKGYRYTDDMEYYFNSLEDANKALRELEKTLNYYSLLLNQSKTKVIDKLDNLEPEWVHYLKTFEFREYKNKKNIVIIQKHDLISFFSRAFDFFREYNNDKGILMYALKTVRKVIIRKENWSIFESLILNVANEDTSTIPIVIDVIESYKFRGYIIDLEKLGIFVNSIIEYHIDYNHEFEVIWALSMARRIGIKIKEENVKLLLSSDNSIIRIMVMLLEEKGLLEGNRNFTHYKESFTEESLYDSNWLFVYECCIQGWLGQDKNVEYIKDNKFYKQILDFNISFINKHHSTLVETIIEIMVEKKYNDMIKKDKKRIKDEIKILSSEFNWNINDEIAESVCNGFIKIIDETKEYEEENKLGFITEYNCKDYLLNKSISNGKVQKSDEEIGKIDKNSDSGKWMNEFLEADIENLNFLVYYEEDQDEYK